MSINKMYIINLFIKVIIVFLNRSGLNLQSFFQIKLALKIELTKFFNCHASFTN